MNRTFLLASTALAACAFFGASAKAATTLSCSDNSTDDVPAVATALGLSGGEPIEITGLCAGDYKFTTNGLTFANSSGNNTLASSDGFNGLVEVASAHETFEGITLEGPGLHANTPSSASGSNFNEQADLIVHDLAQVSLQGVYIGPGAQAGLYETRGAVVSITNSTISGNGTTTTAGNSAGSFTSGIVLLDGSTVKLGDDNDSETVTVQGNGLYTPGTSCQGFDMLLSGNSVANIFFSTIGGTLSTTGGSCGELELEQSSSVRGSDVTIEHWGGFNPIIFAVGDSTVWLDENLNAASPTGSMVEDVADSGSNSTGAILIGAASSILLQDTKVMGPSTSHATLEASGSSSVVLAGANSISGSSGTAVEIDHSSSMFQVEGEDLGYSNSSDLVTGAGLIQEQSSADLGEGLIGDSFTLTWTGSILVEQNSSFRLSGGTDITGSVQLEQGSNGFLNNANGGNATNQVVSGGISCPFTNFPASHLSAPTKVTPTPNMAPGLVSVGAASPGYVISATSPQCLPF